MSFASVEEAMSMLTHTCRRYGSLKISPAHCEIRKARLRADRRLTNPLAHCTYEECRNCLGPVPIGGIPEPSQKPVVPIQLAHDPERKTAKAPSSAIRTCSKCGRIWPATLEYFYHAKGGYLNAVCKDCFKKRQRTWNKKTYKAKKKPKKGAKR
jgi:hypothetical protein